MTSIKLTSWVFTFTLVVMSGQAYDHTRLTSNTYPQNSDNDAPT